MFIDLDEAVRTGEALLECARAIPIIHVGAPFADMAREWRDAAEEAEHRGDLYGITMLGTLSRGMKVANPDQRDAGQPDKVTVRRAEAGRNGGWFLHYDDPEGRNPNGVYANYCSNQSPVVVFRGRPRAAVPAVDEQPEVGHLELLAADDEASA